VWEWHSVRFDIYSGFRPFGKSRMGYWTKFQAKEKLSELILEAQFFEYWFNSGTGISIQRHIPSFSRGSRNP